MNNYALVDDGDGRYSADPGDYWYKHDFEIFTGVTLVKLSHAYRLSTGTIVFAPKMLKRTPIMRDLRRLAAMFA